VSFLDRLRRKPTLAEPAVTEPEVVETAVAEPLVRELDDGELEDARLAYSKNYNHRYMNCGKGSAEIFAVAGTSHCQSALALVAATPRPWRHAADRHVPAVLVREPDNPYDGNAVRVLIDGYMVGPRDVAADRRDLLDYLASTNQRLVCAALIVGGGPDRKFGVRIQVKPSAGTRWAKGTQPPDV